MLGSGFETKGWGCGEGISVCVVFLGKTLYSHSAVLPRSTNWLEKIFREAWWNAGGGNLAPDWHSMQGEGSNSPCHLVPLGSSTDFTYLRSHGTRLSPKRISFVVPWTEHSCFPLHPLHSGIYLPLGYKRTGHEISWNAKNNLWWTTHMRDQELSQVHHGTKTALNLLWFAWRLTLFCLYTFNSHEWPRQNFSLHYQYNIKQTHKEN